MDDEINEIRNQLRQVQNELNETKRLLCKSQNECRNLKKYNQDLISQIALNNSKLHLLLNICDSKSEKYVQTDLSLIQPQQTVCLLCKQENKGKSEEKINWAEVAQDAIDSRDYIYEPNSKTYYSQSSGWYYYPERKLFFDPHSKNYYQYDTQTKSYKFYSKLNGEKEVFKEKNKKIKKEKKPPSDDEQSCEEGEIKDDESGSDSELSEVSSKEPSEDEQQDIKTILENSSCLRCIVRQSDCLDYGSLLLITCQGAVIGSSLACEVTIPGDSVEEKHVKIEFRPEEAQYWLRGLNERIQINGKSIKCEQRISHGDILRISECELLVHYHSGRDVTCIDCEPGCVQSRFSSQTEQINPVISIDREKERRNQLKKMKKLYGVETFPVDEVNSLNSEYVDRAGKRRKTKGSDNPYEKTEIGACAIEKPLSNKNKGFKMLEKLGWKEGEGLGKTSGGNLEPIALEVKGDNRGLGYGM